METEFKLNLNTIQRISQLLDMYLALDIDISCYCGKKITIVYDEEKNIKDTICPKCSYDHIDLLYEFKKEGEVLSKIFSERI